MHYDQYNNPEKNAFSGVSLVLLLFMVAIGSGFGVFYSMGDLPAAWSFVVVGAGSVLGYLSGAWRIFSLFAGSACGYAFAEPTSKRLLPLIEKYFEQAVSDSTVGLAFSGMVAGCASIVVLLLVGTLVIKRSEFLKLADQRLGLFCGCAQACLAVTIFFWGIWALQPRLQSAMSRSHETAHSNITQGLSLLADSAKKSLLLGKLVPWNPIANSPQLNFLLDQADSMIQAKNIVQSAGRTFTTSTKRNSQHNSDSFDIGASIQRMVDQQFPNRP